MNSITDKKKYKTEIHSHAEGGIDQIEDGVGPTNHYPEIAATAGGSGATFRYQGRCTATARPSSAA